MIEMPELVERVDELIAASGTSLGDFARGAGLDASRVSAALDGTSRFSSLDLALIADAHDVTVDWLLTGEPSVLMRAAHLPRGSARRLVEHADDLAGLREGAVHLGAPHRWRPVDAPLVGGPAEQGRALADAALHRVQASGRDVTETDLPGMVEDIFGLDVAVCEVGAGVDGLAVCSAGVWLVVVAATAAAARQRFTLAHELGRLLAEDDPAVLHVDADVCDVGSDPAEMRADAFARCFLLPEGQIVRAADGGLTEAGFVALVRELQASPSLLAQRLTDLGLVDVDVGAGEAWGASTTAEAARTGGWGDELADAMDLALTRRAPRHLRHDLYRIYDAGGATMRPFAHVLGTDSDRLRDMLEPDLG